MRLRPLSLLAAALAALLALAGAAQAQSDACQRYRAELAALERGGGRDYASLARQQAVELERMRQYYFGLNCSQRGFLLFGAPPTPECRAAEDRLAAMEDNYQRLLQEASRGGNDRRQALLAAIEQVCNPQAARPRGLFDGLFGQPQEAPMDPFLQEEAAPRGGVAICVRACDGFFFPLQGAAGDANRAAAMCQAQCPNAQTAVFYKPQGAAIEQAFDAAGRPYTAMPNALRFRASLDPSCACRADGQSWADVLQQAEAMLSGGGEIVTPERAVELSRPREAARGGAPIPRPVGAGPQIPFFGLDQGEIRDVETSEGRRRVRVVAPEVIPAPNTM